MNRLIAHFSTITRHKMKVSALCFRCGLYAQGIRHDLSKYSPIEFCAGVRYYQGNRSPIDREKEVLGYSLGWLHHKGRNMHHWEYWLDNGPKGVHPIRMPVNYVVEMFCDRVAASKTYRGAAYRDSDPYDYYAHSVDHYIIHPDTAAALESLLRILRDEGEERAFAAARKLLKTGY